MPTLPEHRTHVFPEPAMVRTDVFPPPSQLTWDIAAALVGAALAFAMLAYIAFFGSVPGID